MVNRIEKRLHHAKGSYYLVVPMEFVREHGLDREPEVEVFFNGELLVRPIKRAPLRVDEVVRNESL